MDYHFVLDVSTWLCLAKGIEKKDTARCLKGYYYSAALSEDFFDEAACWLKDPHESGYVMDNSNMKFILPRQFVFSPDLH